MNSSLNHTLGPGQYKLPDEFNQARKNGSFAPGTSSFVGSMRKSPVDNRNNLELPGPGEYDSNKSHYYLTTKHLKNGHSSPFASNIFRFRDNDKEVPGPGRYQLPGAFKRSGNVANNFRSHTKREVDFQIPKDIPGAG